MQILRKIRIIVVAGARPNFMKIAPLMRALDMSSQFKAILVHTGQHYDENMSKLFFRELEIPKPDVNLEVGSCSHAQQTAKIMSAFEPIVVSYEPDFVLVVGDVNSTVACGLVAVKLGVKLIHVEAGLRSLDRSMPEEINRIVTDAMGDLLFCSEHSGIENLHEEGVGSDKAFLVGNVMIDTLLYCQKKAEQSRILEKLKVDATSYGILTLHRPSNVDDTSVFNGIITALNRIQNDMPIIFPVHPRTRKRLEETTLGVSLLALPGLCLTEPMGYLDFLKLMSCASLVLTDSGGIQEETTILGVPCLTLRHNTERPITVEMGTNKIVGTDPDRIIDAYLDIRKNYKRKSSMPPLWDGHAAERIVNIMLQEHKSDQLVKKEHIKDIYSSDRHKINREREMMRKAQA